MGGFNHPQVEFHPTPSIPPGNQYGPCVIGSNCKFITLFSFNVKENPQVAGDPDLAAPLSSSPTRRFQPVWEKYRRRFRKIL